MYKVLQLYDDDTIIFNSSFINDDDVEFALNHNFNVIFTESRSSRVIDIMNNFYKRGYEISILEKPRFDDNGLKLDPDIYIKFTLNREKDIKEN